MRVRWHVQHIPRMVALGIDCYVGRWSWGTILHLMLHLGPYYADVQVTHDR